MTTFLNPNVIEIIPGSVYLAASAGKEGLSDLKSLLQNHILNIQRRSKSGSYASSPKLSPPIILPESNNTLYSQQPPPISLASLNFNNSDSIIISSDSTAISSDRNSNRQPHQANKIHPGVLTPGFHVQLMPSFMTPKPSGRPLSAIIEDSTAETKLSIKLLSIDSQFKYQPVANDYGPFCLGQIVRFIRGLTSLLNQPGVDAVVCYCQDLPVKRLNSALLLSAYALLQHGFDPTAAGDLVNGFCVMKMFRDSSMIHERYDISLNDCLNSLFAAVLSGIFCLSTFNLNEYEYYSSFDNGDINIIIPGKIIAFSGPSDNEPLSRFTPSHYCEVFRVLGVTNVIRLNYPEYDPQTFCDIGIIHHDLYFPDGCAPSIGIVAQFLDFVERAEGIVAIHCRAGLGRTGTCIALFLIKHYGFTTHEAVSWIRICRPGSIVGCQYTFLNRIGAYLSEEKNNDIMLNHAAQREKAAELSKDPKNDYIADTTENEINQNETNKTE